MDTITHALSGALLARAIAPVASPISVRARVTAGAAAAAFPDVDFVLSFISPAAFVVGHRGITHSLLLLPLWAALLAWTFARFGRHAEARPRDFFVLAAAGIGIHILGDVITSFGTIVLAPFSQWRAAWSTTFVIDLWFTAIIVAGLAASLVWPRTRIPAVAALAVLAAYVGFQALNRADAVAFGREYAARTGVDAERVLALPQPVSPYNWLVVVEAADRYHLARVKLSADAAGTSRRDDAGRGNLSFIAGMNAAYEGTAAARWSIVPKFGGEPADAAIAKEAFAAAELAFFRQFAELPVLIRVERGNPSTCAWFRDERFVIPSREGVPFQFGACREGEGPWRAFALEGGVRRPARR